MSDETINTNTELENRINSAFSIASSLYPEYAALEEKKAYIEKVWETLKSNFDTNNVTQNKNRSDEFVIAEEVGTKTLLLADFEALIKGRDAIFDGEESLLYVRPNAKQIQSGFEEGWKFDEFTKGYAIFQNPDLKVKGGFTPKFISKLDAMNVFESDEEAASQWEKDTHGHLMQERINMWIGDEDLEYYSYPDTPENRKILKENDWLLEQPLEFEFSEFTEKDFNRIRDELFKDKPKEDYYGRLHIGSLHVEFVINQLDGWVDTNYYILGQIGEGETQFGVPYDHFPGHQFATNLFTDNTYEEFKEKVSKAVLDDIAEESSLKIEAMRPLVDWNNEQQCKELYRTKFVESAKPNEISFIGDEEKMKDFSKLSKEEFLSSYSYLSEEEYEATVYEFNKLNQSAVQSRFSDTIKTVEDINKVYEKNLDFIEKNISFKYSNPKYTEIDEIEKWRNGELYIPVADRNGNYTNKMEVNTLADYNLYANKNFKSYSEVIEYQAGLKAKFLDSAIEHCITECLRREYVETSPNSNNIKFEIIVENQSYPIDEDGLNYITNKNEWGSVEDRLNEIIDKRFEEEIEQKENDLVSDVLEYIAQKTNGNLVLKSNEISDVLFSDEFVQIYAPKKEFLEIQPEKTKEALIEAGIARK